MIDEFSQQHFNMKECLRKKFNFFDLRFQFNSNANKEIQNCF